jgi:DNA-binding beta-propeller fold protein YncE
VRRASVGGLLLLAVTATPPAKAAGEPGARYYVFVLSEASDEIQLVSFGPDGARVEHAVKISLMPGINGPHGIAVSPDKRYYYVSVGHGTPFGTLWKYTTSGDTLLGRVTLGMFPATVDLTPDGAFAYVANFNLYGDMVPSSISIVSTADMVEVARPTTCTMPHGSRVNPRGTKQYSVCMMDDRLVELDTRTLGISRSLSVAGGVACAPTWAQPSRDGRTVYVACNKANEIVEVDVARWAVARRIAAGDGVYNLAVTPNGKLLIATNKRGQSVSVFDVATDRELARIATKRKVVHGATVSSDGRYAFVSVEGVGAEPGTVAVIDLGTLRSVASVDVGEQAAGIDFWKVEPAPGTSQTSQAR